MSPPDGQSQDGPPTPTGVRIGPALLEHLVERSPAIICRGDAGGLGYISPNVERILGYPHAQAMKKGGFWSRIVHPEESERFEAALTAIRASGESHHEFRFRHADGRYLWFSMDLRGDEGVGPTGGPGLLGFFIDVTSRLEAERELDLFFDLSLDMLCIASGDGYFKRLSPAFSRTLGFGIDHLLRTPYLAMVHPDDIEATSREVERQMERGKPVLEFENRYRHADGTWRILSWKSMPQPNGAMYATARDVTLQKAAEAEVLRLNQDLRARAEQLEAANRAAERANLAKNEFLSRMSHELRTPLNAILGFGQLLEMDDLTEDQRENIHQIMRGGRHLLALINEVLDISRIETGTLSFSLEPVPLAAVVAECIDLMRPAARERNITIEPVEIPNRQHVLADRQRLKQVLLNLLSNAIKYNHDGGTVAIVLQALPSAFLRITVQDSGPGIPTDKLGRLFQPFDRLGAEAGNIAGTGLGLALSRSLVEAMEGRLWAESTEGEGARFHMELRDSPSQVEEAQAIEGTEASTARRCIRGTVLYIEDNLSSIRLVERLVGRHIQEGRNRLRHQQYLLVPVQQQNSHGQTIQQGAQFVQLPRQRAIRQQGRVNHGRFALDMLKTANQALRQFRMGCLNARGLGADVFATGDRIQDRRQTIGAAGKAHQRG